MSSTKEELPPSAPTKRTSPLEYRNTDLVSRLLAATPPYLYNMPIVPNSYFFSEMLRSFVQAKTQQQQDTAASRQQVRRARKRSWTQTKQHDSNPPTSSSTATWSDFAQQHQEQQQHKESHALVPNQNQGGGDATTLLPPPPPMWYPPIYPATPYGIDPLHFFIDLRVSGHIYDRKQAGKEQTDPSDLSIDSTQSNEADKFPGFKQSRHASAFSVPNAQKVRDNSRDNPLNLSASTKSIKFDVKSMGFERDENKQSVNYIMSNVGRIYNDLHALNMRKSECSGGGRSGSGSGSEPSAEQSESGDKPQREETDEEREKRVKDLRALIGLELVVDYMNHAKPGMPKMESEHLETNPDDDENSNHIEIVSVDDKDDC